MPGTQIKALELLTQGLYTSWHRAIFPGGLPPSIVAADRLYLRVRDGNGCVPVASAPRNPLGSGVFYVKHQYPEDCIREITTRMIFIK